jgi:hypothetical protein
VKLLSAKDIYEVLVVNYCKHYFRILLVRIRTINKTLRMTVSGRKLNSVHHYYESGYVLLSYKSLDLKGSPLFLGSA